MLVHSARKRTINYLVLSTYNEKGPSIVSVLSTYNSCPYLANIMILVMNLSVPNKKVKDIFMKTISVLCIVLLDKDKNGNVR